jgi:hypothetical protein
MNIHDRSACANERPGLDHPMAGIVLLVILSFAILAGSILVSGLRFANAAGFFVPFGGALALLALIKIYYLVRRSKNERFEFFVTMTIVK